MTIRGLALFSVAPILLLAGCRLLGLTPIACSEGQPATCPGGLRCVAGECVAEGGADGGVDGGTGSGGEVLAEGQPGVVLIAERDDGVLFWATGGENGCVRRLVEDRVEEVTCEQEGHAIAGLALAADRLFWLGDATSAGGDVVRTLPSDAAPSDTPTTIDQGLDLRHLDEGGPSLLDARDITSAYAVAYIATPNEYETTRRLLLAGDSVTTRTNYGDGTLGRDEAAVALTESDLFFVIDGDYARLVIRDGHASDDGGGYSIYSEDGLAGFPDGQGWATCTRGEDVWASTRAATDHGAILHSQGLWNGGWLVVDLVVEQVDPDDRGKYAAGLAADVNHLYWATAGGETSPDRLFRLSFAPESEPEPIAELDAPPGMLLLTDTHLVWSEPSSGRILSTPKP